MAKGQYTRTSKEIKAQMDINAASNALLEEEINNLNSIFSAHKRNLLIQEQQLNIKKNTALLEEHYLKQLREGENLTETQQKTLEQEIAKQKRINAEEDKKISKQKKSNELYKHYLGFLSKSFSLQAGWIKGLNENDKIIRQTILNLGMSGKKADIMRGSFEDSAMIVAQMGGSLVDIQTVMQGFADETGRARVLTSEMVTDIIKIGRGTGIGVETATQMAAQFELMGYDAKSVNTMIQGFVETSERMGLNTSKIFKDVNTNFKRLQTYSFQGGVKGMLQMSQYATKMNIDMNQALNATDAAKTLEKAIDLAANLQIMGGEFAKTDPFEMLFLSRNDPAKYTQKINEMTKGVVTFRKMADGSFEKYISPADRDRLAAVAKSLGMDTAELTQQALRMKDIQKMRQNMLSSSLSSKDKETIEGMAIYNKETGNFQVKIGDVAKNINAITESEARAFLAKEASLEKRAKDSRTFEEALNDTLASFKTVLLPMLRGFNSVIEAVRPTFERIAKALSGIPATIIVVAGMLTGAAVILSGIAGSLTKAYYVMTGKGAMGSRAAGAATYAGGGGNPHAGAYDRGGKSAMMRGKGKMMAGAGIGAAAVGIGAGIGVAALGISQLAKAIKDVDVDKLKQMNITIGLLGVTMGGILITVAALGTTGAAAAPGLFAISVAAVAIGAGIGIAAYGIGKMAEGLGSMIEKSKGAGKGLMELGMGVSAMASGMALFNLGALGLLTFTATLASIAAFSKPLERVGAAFKEINVAMKGSSDDYIAITNAVSSISAMNTGNNSAIAQLAQLLKSPLKVEFADSKATFVSDITLNISGEKFMQKVFAVNTAAQKARDARAGKAL